MHRGDRGIAVLEQQGCGQAHNVRPTDHHGLLAFEGNLVASEELNAALLGRSVSSSRQCELFSALLGNGNAPL